MRTWVVDGTGEPRDVLRLLDTPTPEPGPGMVRVAVAAAAVGLPDVLMCRGSYALTPNGPFTPGQEVVGTVTAVGDEVDADLVGARVMGVTAFYAGHGGFAEETICAARTVFPAPDWLTDVDAAGFHIPFTTGWIGLMERGGLQPDEHLVVLGAAGGSGAAAVQIGNALGANVIAVVGGAAKAAFAESMGAAHVIDHATDDVVAAIREVTDGHGADVVYDPVGGEAAATAARTMANAGRFLVVGFASGSWASIDGAAMVYKNFSTVGVYAGAYDRAFNEQLYATMLPKLQADELTSIVTTVEPFERVPDALTELAARSAVGKTVVTLS